MSELHNRDFKAYVIEKNTSTAITNTLETKEKIENLSNDIECLCK